jgi:Tol biopolymer transport system component
MTTANHKSLTRKMLILGILVNLLMACSPQTISNSDQPSEARLLFEKQVEEVKAIYSFNINKPEDEFSPLLEGYRHLSWVSISPNGRYAVIRDGEVLRIVDLISGQEIIQLDAGAPSNMDFQSVKVDNDIVWSPTSEQFAYIYNSPSPRTDIMMFDLTTEKLRQLTNDDAQENALSWSPDGKILAFAVLESCGVSLVDCPLEQQYWDVATLNLESEERDLITDMSDKLIPGGGWTVNSICHLQWSPNQEYIAFKSHCPANQIPVYDNIFVAATDGSQTWQLTEFLDIDYANNYSVKWASDNRNLIVGYSRDFIFDDLSDDRGFLIFDIESFGQEPTNNQIPQLNVYDMNWSDSETYFIGSLTDNRRILGTVTDGWISIISDDLPEVSMAGYWSEDGYITQLNNTLVKVTIPNGELLDLGYEVEAGMQLIGWREVYSNE